MDNIIATCYVIESKDYGVEPTIYLNRPNIHPQNEKLHLCYTPFEAKKLIRVTNGDSVEITVSKETTSQLRLFSLIEGGGNVCEPS